MTDVLFVVRSRFSRQIRLTTTIWRKIEAQHPEFRAALFAYEALFSEKAA